MSRLHWFWRVLIAFAGGVATGGVCMYGIVRLPPWFYTPTLFVYELLGGEMRRVAVDQRIIAAATIMVILPVLLVSFSLYGAVGYFTSDRRTMSDRYACWLYPDLKKFEDERTRREVLRQCSKDVRLVRRNLLLILCGALLPQAWMAAQPPLALFLLSRHASVRIGAGFACVVYVAIPFLTLVLVVRRARQLMQPRLRQMLARQGIALCSECGYNLAGNVSGTCPECGESIGKAG